MAFIGAGYAVVLQRRQLEHKQTEIEKAQAERNKAVAWEHRTAMLNATSFLAQTTALKLAALPDAPRTTEMRGGASQKENDAKERARVEFELNKYMQMLANFLEQAETEYGKSLNDAEACSKK